MKVLMINGSPRKDGNTARALKEIADTLKAEGVESEIFWLGAKPVRGCIACGQCSAKGLGRCAFDDDAANRIIEKLADADGIILGSPTYYGQPNGALLAVWQRVCFAGGAVVRGQAGRQCGDLPARRFLGGVPDDEHAVRDAELPARHVAVLECSLRKRAGRMRPGHRGNADHAHARPQHGVAPQIHQGQSASGAGALATHALHTIKKTGCSCNRCQSTTIRR